MVESNASFLEQEAEKKIFNSNGDKEHGYEERFNYFRIVRPRQKGKLIHHDEDGDGEGIM